MDSKKTIEELFSAYLEEFLDEKTRLDQFDVFLRQTQENNVFNRKNFVGHITASALIVNSSRSEILLLEHKALKRWLQPGGHIEEEDESILAAVYREIEEETGIKQDQLASILIGKNGYSRNMPIDIDTHPIPENAEKSEASHFHHDFRYLFLYTGGEKIDYNQSESTGYKWVDFSELSQQVTFAKLLEKIRHFLSFEFRTKHFYDTVANQVKKDLKKRAVVVSHIIPDCLFYLRAIEDMYQIISIIPKPNSIDEQVYEIVEKEFRLTRLTREEMENPKNALVELIEKESGDLVLFDIGGYFSKIHQTWPSDVLNRITHIIEDTENGHQKYESSGSDLKIVSVARSPLKDNEDFLVGQSILFSADSILRTGGTLIQYMSCSVLGYGKIGKSITFHLLQRGIKPRLYDVNPIKRIEAFNNLCSIPTREEIILNSDVIFSATGNRSMDIQDFRKIKDGCFVFSVTSSDDEMNLDFLAGEYRCTEIRPKIYKYHNDSNFFFLVNNGNAVNFLHNAVMGSFIHLVRAEMIFASTVDAKSLSSGINILQDSIRENVANIWLSIFDPENRQLSNVEYLV